ncbi:MAG: hypothetical protein LBV58_03705 [Acholeplasmatales bacterium]|jgi:preprotein translocase subunit SecE|nr:hypothetical protein [Acholeplasmatales bacterium]
MAIKKKEETQKSKLIELLTTDYRFENLLLGIASIAAAVLSLMIITKLGPLTIAPNFPVLGEEPYGLIFAWILFAISIFGLFLVLFPFVSAAIPEIRKIQWANFKKFREAFVRTVIVVVVLTGVIILFDLIIKLIMLRF